jgi:hypothetical protein
MVKVKSPQAAPSQWSNQCLLLINIFYILPDRVERIKIRIENEKRVSKSFQISLIITEYQTKITDQDNVKNLFESGHDKNESIFFDHKHVQFVFRTLIKIQTLQFSGI